MSRSIVLVHGAWHGAWCWARVMEGLAAKGIDAVAVDLPGHGSDDRPLCDLHTDAERVRQVLDDRPGRRFVLVGHSYGGAVITEAGNHPSVRHLVFLCAMALTEAESCSSVAAGDPAAASISHDGRPDLSQAVVPDDEGMLTLEPTLAAACLCNECDHDTGMGRVAWRSKPSTYAVCANDRIVPGHAAVRRAAGGA